MVVVTTTMAMATVMAMAPVMVTTTMETVSMATENHLVTVVLVTTNMVINIVGHMDVGDIQARNVPVRHRATKMRPLSRTG